MNLLSLVMVRRNYCRTASQRVLIETQNYALNRGVRPRKKKQRHDADFLLSKEGFFWFLLSCFLQSLTPEPLSLLLPLSTAFLAQGFSSTTTPNPPLIPLLPARPQPRIVSLYPVLASLASSRLFSQIIPLFISAISVHNN